jgi:hypothetical protein
MAWVRKKEMVDYLQSALLRAGYSVTKAQINQAYSHRAGSRQLYRLWYQPHLAIHWVAQVLEKRGVVFHAKPKREPESMPVWPAKPVLSGQVFRPPACQHCGYLDPAQPRAWHCPMCDNPWYGAS